MTSGSRIITFDGVRYRPTGEECRNRAHIIDPSACDRQPDLCSNLQPLPRIPSWPLSGPAMGYIARSDLNPTLPLKDGDVIAEWSVMDRKRYFHVGHSMASPCHRNPCECSDTHTLGEYAEHPQLEGPVYLIARANPGVDA